MNLLPLSLVQRLASGLLLGTIAAVAESPPETTHWSFTTLPQKIPLPPLTNKADHPIDAFIQQQLEDRGLDFNPPAQASTLIRRLHFDLVGLPPSPDEVTRFLRAEARGQLEQAYCQEVDKLLASPRYGERWGQHWLDVICWAETVGFETNIERPNAWPYRDWVINALNQDKPYDRMIFEQLAGDTVGEDAALGFLVAGPANLPGQIGRDEAAMRGARQDELDEVIRTVSQGLLGLTVGCARCHDHKFDPILQRDYYAMQGIFAGLRYGNRRLRGSLDDEWAQQLPALRKRLQTLEADLEQTRLQYGLQRPLEEIQEERFAPTLAKAVRMTLHATGNGANASLYEFEAWTPPRHSSSSRNVALASAGATPSASSFALANQSRHYENLIDGSVDRRQAYPWVAAQSGSAWIRIDFRETSSIDRVIWHRGSSMPADYTIELLEPGSDAWVPLIHTRKRLPRVDDTRSVDRLRLSLPSQTQIQTIHQQNAAIRATRQHLARRQAGPQVYGARFDAQPEPTFLLHRGDAMRRRNPVAPDVPRFLGGIDLEADEAEPRRRIALAQHLTQPQHPLTARVLVNRIWHHHFGTGLVSTPSDFGTMGTAPSHPRLLDWLGARFVRDRWSLKTLHRLIVTSRTFRQSSRPRPEALAIDADSRSLWRYPPRRLEAEAIRDAILKVSGNLNLSAGGRGFDFFNQRGGLSDYTAKERFDESGWRRMIYAHKVRMISVDVFGAFDCPDAGQMKPSRSRSVTPVQSLGLFNSPFANRQSAFFAQRVRAEAGDGVAQQVRHACFLALARSPSSLEQETLITLAREQGLEQVCRALLNTSEFLYLQ